MKSSEHLFLAIHGQTMEKQAFPQLVMQGGRALASKLPGMASKVPGMLSNIPGKVNGLAARPDFLGGLAAPVAKFQGGMQRMLGYGQQGVAKLRNLNAPHASAYRRDPLFQRGRANLQAGATTRQQNGFLSGLGSGKSPGYRVGRGVGAVALGAPLMSAPFVGAEYAGAATVDPATVQEYAKYMAQDRVNGRMQQFASMPFMQRMQTAWNPESFTQQVAESAPEAASLQQAMTTGGANNPGIMKYLNSFNPFSGSADDVIGQKVRATMLQGLQNGTPKQATVGSLLTRFAAPAARAGWNTLRGNSSAAGGLRSLSGILRGGAQPASKLQTSVAKGVYGLAANPSKALMPALGAGGMGYFMNNSFNGGRQSVYNHAGSNAQGMADLAFMERFNQPGFMGGATRFGAALAPGMAQNYVNKQMSNILYQGK